ncbi:MAG: hypothetical protein J5809_02705 [Selenomonadaceae bacterium]|nr:hypothetical protein [Selenomonadaceae bacterium]
MGKIHLRIDCSNLTSLAISNLIKKLSWFVEPVFVGGDTIYVEARVHHNIYASIWKILDKFNVTVD